MFSKHIFTKPVSVTYHTSRIKKINLPNSIHVLLFTCLQDTRVGSFKIRFNSFLALLVLCQLVELSFCLQHYILQKIQKQVLKHVDQQLVT